MVISSADKSNYAHKFVTNSTQIASDKQTNKHARALARAHTHTHTHTHTHARTLSDLRSFAVHNFSPTQF